MALKIKEFHGELPTRGRRPSEEAKTVMEWLERSALTGKPFIWEDAASGDSNATNVAAKIRQYGAKLGLKTSIRLQGADIVAMAEKLSAEEIAEREAKRQARAAKTPEPAPVEQTPAKTTKTAKKTPAKRR